MILFSVQKLMTSEARLFTAEKELETMRNHASMNVKLKEQVRNNLTPHQTTKF